LISSYHSPEKRASSNVKSALFHTITTRTLALCPAMICQRPFYGSSIAHL